MDKNFYESLEKAIAVANQHEAKLLQLPGVLSVGAGPERKAGKMTGKAAIIVMVAAKKAKSELTNGNALPATLDGIPVDVIERGKPVEAPEIIAAQQQAAQAVDAVKEEWLRRPNVTALGVGYKTVGGVLRTNQIALKVFVAKKLLPDDVKKQNLASIPPEINGVPTDVEELPPMRPASTASGSRDDRRDPLVGGLTVGVNTKPFWYGTLGSIVFDRSTGEQLVLSNQHVLDGPAGTDVVQPSPIGLDDSLEIGFQLDVCGPLHFFRLDTPNTTVGSVLASAAIACVVAASLSDDIDPTRRGQQATMPPAGAKTFAESHKVRLTYPEMPTPGTHFKVKTDWQYTRHATTGDQSFSVSEVKENPHVLVDKLLLTDKKLYHPGETIRLFGLILPEVCAPKAADTNTDRHIPVDEIPKLSRHINITPPSLAVATAKAPRLATDDMSFTAAAINRTCRCDRYHLTALLTPTKVDRAFPVVLREPVVKNKTGLMTELVQIAANLENRELQARIYRMLRYGCFYTGELAVGDIPKGPWRHMLYVQTVNVTPAGMDPLEAAKIIGGLPVSQNTTPQVDLACGPVTYEDGQFDVELL